MHHHHHLIYYLEAFELLETEAGRVLARPVVEMWPGDGQSLEEVVEGDVGTYAATAEAVVGQVHRGNALDP